MKQFLFFTFFLSALVSFGNQGWVKLYKLKQFEKNMEHENRLLAENNAALRQEIDDLKDPGYVERYIREELDFVRDNEVLFQAP